MEYINPSALRKRTVTRSSLACLPCRVRHVKCDGKRPRCSRCVVSETPCDYTRSRRGGLDRAALAERRRRRVEASSLPDGDSLTDPPAIAAIGQNQPVFDSLNGVTDVSQSSGSKPPIFSLLESGIGHPQNVEDDVLIDLYYKRFHKSHPLTIPQKHLFKLWQDPSIRPRLVPLAAVLRLVGHLYRSQEWPTPLQNVIEVCFLQSSQTDPFMVQCRILYSIVLFWHNYKAEASHQITGATRLAVDLGMFRREFALKHGGADTVLRECWRRTWWMLYIVCGYFTGTLGTLDFAVLDVEATVELPCVEAEYEMGKIPEPKTLEEFDCREFAFGNTPFSSFAYLIGAVRCAAAIVPLIQNITTNDVSQQVICTADSIIDGWLLLLPTDTNQIIDKYGEIDQLMFQATLVIHVATIGLHRPFSDLRFNTMEAISSCARQPSPDTPIPEVVNVHTLRVMRSVEAQIFLLGLPARSFHHTPFITCMLSEGTLALLSACKFMLNGRELARARDQIRMTIGRLRALGQTWPRTAKNVKEIQVIARYVLGLKEIGNNLSSSSMPHLPTCDGDGGQQSGDETLSSNVLHALNPLDGLCSMYSAEHLEADLSWWVGP